MRVVSVGAGNLATRLTLALRQAGHTLLQVYSRSEGSARRLASQLDCAYTHHVGGVMPGADVYIFAVTDDALPGLVDALAPVVGGSLCLHTAGSVPMQVFGGKVPHYGVLYPMQTFSRTRQVAFRNIPCFVEAPDAADLLLVQELARSVSDHVQVMDGARRRYLHLAAVFACNFVNHCYALSASLLQEQGIPFEVMHPLIEETARKAMEMPPMAAQTGPAVRFDHTVMDAHVALLQGHDHLAELYRMMSEGIHSMAINAREQHDKL